MRQFCLGLGLAVVLFGLPQAGQASIVTNVDVPFSTDQFVPCANGGAGEDVIFNGTVHALVTLTMDNAGGAHAFIHTNFNDVSGVGDLSGDKYQATGVIDAEANLQIGEELTIVIRVNAIGQGPGNNLYLDATEHMTINADGTVTVFFTDISVVCK